jgi:glycosyltransferase involved in cell wall biosynthesis
MTKVSIVVCTYSMERYGPFSECIESVFDQEYDSLEVALVVDGSGEVMSAWNPTLAVRRV